MRIDAPLNLGSDIGWLLGLVASACTRSSANRWCSRPSKDTDRRNRAGIMRSVSMLSPRTGRPLPAIVTIVSTGMACKLPDVDDLTGHCCGGDHGRTH